MLHGHMCCACQALERELSQEGLEQDLGQDTDALSQLNEELVAINSRMDGVEESMQASQQAMSEHSMRIRALKKQLTDVLRAKALAVQSNVEITQKLAGLHAE